MDDGGKARKLDEVASAIKAKFSGKAVQAPDDSTLQKYAEKLLDSGVSNAVQFEDVLRNHLFFDKFLSPKVLKLPAWHHFVFTGRTPET